MPSEFPLDNSFHAASYSPVSQRGVFISFEGVDGCGKSTQIKELRRRMRGLQDRIVLTREPGGTLLGEDIRKVLQRTADSREIQPAAELLLFTASRAQLVQEVLEPSLADGKHVIADRFLDSTTIYQGVARGLDPATVKTINRFAVGTCLPDITFLIDVDTSVSRERMISRGSDEPLDRIENSPDAFFTQVREGYLELAAAEPARFVVIDGRQKVGEISDEIWTTLTDRYHGLFG